MICMRNYNAAHNRAICGVAVRPNSITSFATASLDQYVTLWDDNIVKPVIGKTTLWFSKLTVTAVIHKLNVCG